MCTVLYGVFARDKSATFATLSSNGHTTCLPQLCATNQLRPIMSSAASPKLKQNKSTILSLRVTICKRDEVRGHKSRNCSEAPSTNACHHATQDNSPLRVCQVADQVADGGDDVGKHKTPTARVYIGQPAAERIQVRSYGQFSSFDDFHQEHLMRSQLTSHSWWNWRNNKIARRLVQACLEQYRSSSARDEDID